MAGLQGVENLFDRQDRMASYGPTFCDITWGAGGTTADLTLDIAAKMQNMVRDCTLKFNGGKNLKKEQEEARKSTRQCSTCA